MIYVDALMDHGWILRARRVKSCHLFSDSDTPELNNFALKIGMRIEWCQQKNSIPHYDLTESRRQLAVDAGAIEVGRRAAVQIWRVIRAKKIMEKEMTHGEEAAKRIAASEAEFWKGNEVVRPGDPLLVALAYLAPIPMLLFCPACHTQHVDAPEPDIEWTNPPHRSHKCKKCGHVWRPCDRPTTGVPSLVTVGQADGSPFPVSRPDPG